MNFVMFGAILSGLLIQLSAFSATSKIVGGNPLQFEHPGKFNAVALVKEDGKIFCTGSIIAENLIATAKHCLVDKELTDFKLYFGENTEEKISTLYRNATAFSVRYPKDWSMMFPSFDVAWVEFEGSLPENFHPLPILTNPDQLEIAMPIEQVGYGNHSLEMGTIEAGQKLFGQTILKEYVNDARFFNILLFHGGKGQGSCHGDSGGPAYAQINGQWFIIGVTNGFDIVLTPQTMTRTGDDDFPYRVDCSNNQSLYSFLGAHANWIQESSGHIIKSDGIIPIYDRQQSKQYTSLVGWCEARNFGHPSWNLLKVLLDQNVDAIDQEEAEDFYKSCDLITTYLSSIEEIILDGESVMEGVLSFENLQLIPKLKKITLKNFDPDKILIDTLINLELQELTLKNIQLRQINQLSNTLSFKKLNIENNPIASLNGIENQISLESLNISSTPIKNLEPLSEIKLKELYASSLNVSFLLNLDLLSINLEVLDLRYTPVPRSMTLTRFTNLRELWLTGLETKVDLSNSEKIEFLNLKDFNQTELILPKSLKNLKQLNATNCNLSDLDFLSTAQNLEKATLTFNRITNLDVFNNNQFPHLRDLNLSVNPIQDVSALSNLDGLEVLRLFRTIIQRNLIPRTEQNCPTTIGSEALRKFCRK